MTDLNNIINWWLENVFDIFRAVKKKKKGRVISPLLHTCAIRWCCRSMTRDIAICMPPNTATTSKILSSKLGAVKFWRLKKNKKNVDWIASHCLNDLNKFKYVRKYDQDPFFLCCFKTGWVNPKTYWSHCILCNT